MRQKGGKPLSEIVIPSRTKNVVRDPERERRREERKKQKEEKRAEREKAIAYVERKAKEVTNTPVYKLAMELSVHVNGALSGMSSTHRFIVGKMLVEDSFLLQVYIREAYSTSSLEKRLRRIKRADNILHYLMSYLDVCSNLQGVHISAETISHAVATAINIKKHLYVWRSKTEEYISERDQRG